VFVDVGAGNVIWAWSPNVINPVPKVALKPYYPGDGYVDWVGLIGYFTIGSDDAFSSVFGPTMKQVRTFTKRPFLILETAAEPGRRRRADIRNLFNGVSGRDDVLGFIWSTTASAPTGGCWPARWRWRSSRRWPPTDGTASTCGSRDGHHDDPRVHHP
jgi:glycosyl hydrolase family 26